jgi:hypothetical protein
MDFRRICPELAIIAGVIAVLVACSPRALAGTVNVKGSIAGTSVTANFTFDGVTQALSIISTGSDNIGGPFTSQEIEEDTLVAASDCTAPDGSAGIVFEPVKEITVATYIQDQLYSFGAGAAAGTTCVSPTTGSFSTTDIHSVFGGTGKFAGASGSFTLRLTGQFFSAPPSVFGAFQGTETGSIAD